MEKLKHKIPPPVMAAIFAVLALIIDWILPGLYLRFAGQTFVAIVLVFLGIGVAVLALHRLSKNKTTVSPLTPQETSSLVTDGIFNYSRNPIYVGLALVLVGFCLFLQNYLSFVIVPAFIYCLTVLQIEGEEDILTEKFGADFEDYKQRVRRWL